MKFPVRVFETVLIDVGVDLRRRDIGVAEHFLDHAQVRAVGEQVRGKAVPHLVRMDVLFEAAGRGAFEEDAAQALAGEAAAAFAEENVALRFRAHE